MCSREVKIGGRGGQPREHQVVVVVDIGLCRREEGLKVGGDDGGWWLNQ